MVNHTRLDCLLGAAHGLRRGTARRSTMPSTGARSAPCSSTSPRCSTCSPTWRSNPRPRPPPRCASRAAMTTRAGEFRRLATAVMKYWVQARSGPRRGGARVPGRQRLRRGLGDAAAAARLAAQLDLGGVGQRRRARRAARDRAGAGGDGRVPRRVRAGAGARPPARRAPGGAARAARRAGASVAEADAQFAVRSLVEDLALALQGSLLVRHAPAAVADGFCAGRLRTAPGGSTAPSPPASTRRRSSRAPTRQPDDPRRRLSGDSGRGAEAIGVSTSAPARRASGCSTPPAR